MRIAIEHKLNLTPPPGVPQVLLHLLLTPPAGVSQSVENWSVEVAGIGNAGRFSDGFGNLVHLVNQARPEGDICVTVRGEVVTTDTHGVLGRVAGEPVPALYKRVTPLTKAPVTLYGKYRNAKESRLDILHGLMARVGETLGLPEPEETQTQMQADGGQSQSQGTAPEPDIEETELPPASDYVHLFIGAARALDIPARFVTGYLLDEDGKSGRLHVWAEAFDTGLGWIGFDPVMQMCPTNRYVRLCVGLDAEAANPLRVHPAVDVTQSAQLSGKA